MRVDVSAEAGEFASGRGGRLGVWAAHPRVCCWGTPAYMPRAEAYWDGCYFAT